jgi:TatD DNase family protein
MEEYDSDRRQVIDRAVKENISFMLTVGTEEKYFSRVIEIIDGNPCVYGAIGIHPHNARDYSNTTEKAIRATLTHPKIVGYGEIGLDFYRDHSPRSIQKAVFERQIALAKEYGLPLIIHSRDSKDETITVLKAAGLNGYPTVIHCYSYDLDAAKTFLEMGFYLSVPGTVTYRNPVLADVIRSTPLERLLSETDSPFLAPTPKRGKRNEPAYVRFVVEEIARLKGTSIQETTTILKDNFSTLFLNDRKEGRTNDW